MTIVVADKELSPSKAREAKVRAMSNDELLEHALKLSVQLQTAKMFLRAASKKFRWYSQPTDAQDIDKFLDGCK